MSLKDFPVVRTWMTAFQLEAKVTLETQTDVEPKKIVVLESHQIVLHAVIQNQ